MKRLYQFPYCHFGPYVRHSCNYSCGFSNGLGRKAGDCRRLYWNGYFGTRRGSTPKYQEKIRLEEEKKKLLLQMKGRATKTQSGKEVQLYANIGNVSDLALVLANDAGGIGLFRSEFLFLDQDHLPTEEEQFYAYRQVAETMAGKKVIIRTLDLGADIQVDYFKLDPEENPAMGLRAIRICLTRPEIFKTQLRAIFRASLYGNLSIMYPMIISVEEIRQIKEIVRQVKQELKEEQIEIGVVEEGIMIETPAAVMISDLLAKEVDSFSIGTNDLTQYTLAIDRQNTKLDQFYNPYHESILRMIELVERFVQMGIDELSVAPGCILPLRKRICEME